MRNLLVIISLFCVFNSTAQSINFLASNAKIKSAEKNYTISKTYLKKEIVDIEKATKCAKRLKITGLILTSLGTVGIATTTPFIVKSSKTTTTYPLDFGGFGELLIATMGYLPSSACVVAGIPMTIVGFKKSKKLKVQTAKVL